MWRVKIKRLDRTTGREDVVASYRTRQEGEELPIDSVDYLEHSERFIYSVHSEPIDSSGRSYDSPEAWEKALKKQKECSGENLLPRGDCI